MDRGPEQELETFLRSLHPLERKQLEHGFSALTKKEMAEWFEIQRPNKTEEYEDILQRTPAKLREYNQRQIKERTLFNTYGLRPIPKGRPKKDALATEAVKLKKSKSYAQVAKTLNAKHGEGTATAESVRKLLRRHGSKSKAKSSGQY